MFSRNERSLKSRDPGLGFKSILVPVDGSDASIHAVEFACTLAKRSRGKVHVVHVIEVRRALALDAELTAEAQSGEEVLSRAEAAAKLQDFEVEGDLLQARDASHAIVDEAVEREADAIILGVPFTRPFGEFGMGRVPTHILKSATCEVIVLRLPSE